MITSQQVRTAAKTMAHYTAQNCTTLSLKRLALLLGDSASVKALDSIEWRHDRLGSLTEELSKERKVIYDKLLLAAKARLTPSQYDLVHGNL
jgi:hypothetical protein